MGLGIYRVRVLVLSQRSHITLSDLSQFQLQVGDLNCVILKCPFWIYYHIPNVMHYSKTAPETTSFAMYDSNTFFQLMPLFLMALQISYTYISNHKHHEHY